VSLALVFIYVKLRSFEQVVIENASTVPRVGDDVSFGYGSFVVAGVTLKFESGAMHHAVLEVRPKDERGLSSLSGPTNDTDS
jgi:hypothetical protein